MKNKRILSALIGLVGAIESNGKLESTDDIVRQALLSEDSEEIIASIYNEKYKISPSCKTCVAPCGNTSDFDIEQLEQCADEIKNVKYEIIAELKNIAINSKELPAIVYKSIAYLKYDLKIDAYNELLKEMIENG